MNWHELLDAGQCERFCLGVSFPHSNKGEPEMAYKSVLTIGTSAQSATRGFAAAANLAMAQDGHLDGLALGIDRTQLGYSYVGAGAVLTQMQKRWKPP
jgi:hypothetical protein